MRPVSLLVLAHLAAVVCPAQEQAPEAVGGPSEWRIALRSEFKFERATTVEQVKSVTVPAVDPNIVSDPNVVSLAPYVVNEASEDRGLPGAIQAEKQQASPLAPILGTGAHKFMKLGNTEFYYITLFHVPVMVGMRW